MIACDECVCGYVFFRSILEQPEEIVPAAPVHQQVPSNAAEMSNDAIVSFEPANSDDTNVSNDFSTPRIVQAPTTSEVQSVSAIVAPVHQQMASNAAAISNDAIVSLEPANSGGTNVSNAVSSTQVSKTATDRATKRNTRKVSERIPKRVKKPTAKRVIRNQSSREVRIWPRNQFKGKQMCEYLTFPFIRSLSVND